MNSRFISISLSIAAAFMVPGETNAAAGKNPFPVSGQILETRGKQQTLSIFFSVPSNHYLYADAITVTTTNGTALTPSEKPSPYRKHDKFSDTERDVYTNNFTMHFIVTAEAQSIPELIIGYQGCNEQLCFFPVTTNLSFSTKNASNRHYPAQPQPALNAFSLKELTSGFRVTGKKEGYIRAEEFKQFLDMSLTGNSTETDKIKNMFTRHGTWAMLAVLMIVAGGLGLNLTPCVLPMIPINIAIIGAGTEAGSRLRGFALGSLYGGAIALTYGLLGLFVVLTGSRFGTLNASYIFNAAIAVILVFLALAMFDVFTIDFSRLQSGMQTGSRSRGNMLTALVMGTVSALLAGACVAPVVVSVLLLSSDLFKHGNTIGLFLPFLLGFGMGLPWPFLGAGLSFLPKPGRWMARVKHLFGIAIIGFAAYYAHLSYRLFSDQQPENKSRVELAQKESIRHGWLVSLPEALATSEKENKPLFIDFWASWCKNCLAMEETTFKDPEVKKKLESFTRLKFRAENPSDPATTHVMEFFNCLGLPTYVVLVPEKKKEHQHEQQRKD